MSETASKLPVTLQPVQKFLGVRKGKTYLEVSFQGTSRGVVFNITNGKYQHPLSLSFVSVHKLVRFLQAILQVEEDERKALLQELGIGEVNPLGE